MATYHLSGADGTLPRLPSGGIDGLNPGPVIADPAPDTSGPTTSGSQDDGAGGTLPSLPSSGPTIDVSTLPPLPSGGPTIDAGSTDAGSQPALDLDNSSAGTVRVPGNPYQPYISPAATVVQPAPDYATINVQGDSSITHLEVGSLTDGSAEADVNLGQGATLTATFFVGNGATLNVSGDDSSSLDLANSSPTPSEIRGGHMVVDAPVAGQGTIFMDGPYVPGLRIPLPSGFIPGSASLEVGSSVGSDVTIAIRAGDLQIDNPMAFAGRIDLVASPPPMLPSYIYTTPAGPQSVTLEGVAATAYSFDDSSHTMTLFNGGDVVDQVGFTSDITASSFMPNGSSGPDNAISVAQTAGGVFLSHLPSSTSDSATLIPMQT